MNVHKIRCPKCGRSRIYRKDGTRYCRTCGASVPLLKVNIGSIKTMTRFQDKTEQEQKDEMRALILMYAKSEGDRVPSEDQLTAEIEKIMNDLKTRTTPGQPAVSTVGMTGENPAVLPDAEIERRAREILAVHDPAEDDDTMRQARAIMARPGSGGGK
jgi:uncharacterized Zn finger protein (UPF0148 family)